MNLLGMNPDLNLPDPAIMTDTRDAMVSAVRRNVKFGVDQIKIYVTGSLPQVARPDFQALLCANNPASYYDRCRVPAQRQKEFRATDQLAVSLRIRVAVSAH